MNYTQLKENGELHQFEESLKEGKIKLSKDDVNDIFGLTLKDHRKIVRDNKKKSEFYVYQQHKFKVETETKILEQTKEIKQLEESRDRYKEKYYSLKDKMKKIAKHLE